MKVLSSQVFLILYYIAFGVMGFSWIFYLIHEYNSEVTLNSVYVGPLLALFIIYTFISLICFIYIFISSFFLYKKIGFKGKIYICVCIISLFFFQYLIGALTEKRLAPEREIQRAALEEIYLKSIPKH